MVEGAGRGRMYKPGLRRAAARRQALQRAYAWHQALHRLGPPGQVGCEACPELRVVVQARMNREYARRWRVYLTRLAAWRARVRKARKRAAAAAVAATAAAEVGVIAAGGSSMQAQ
jgi:hypothetical protein